MSKILFLAVACFYSLWAVGQYPIELMTVPEITRYDKTSSYADVMTFVYFVDSTSDKLHLEILLTSKEGKDIPLLIISDSGVITPEQARESKKLVVYIQGNIHGGEVKGKEAIMILIREILFGNKSYLLENQVILFVPINAAYIISEIGDIKRFNTFKKLACYVGIVPNVYSSGENTSAFGVSPRANRTVRSLLVEASWVAIRIDPALQQYYRKHARHNCKAAIFKVARKLLSRIYAVIKTETDYQIGVVE